MDLGTKALVVGAAALLTAWIPLLNILAFVAALMAVGFGVLARWRTGWVAAEDPDEGRALWGIVLGVLALVEFGVAAWWYAGP